MQRARSAARSPVWVAASRNRKLAAIVALLFGASLPNQLSAASIRVPNSTYTVTRNGAECQLAGNLQGHSLFIFYAVHEGRASFVIAQDGPPHRERPIQMTLRFDGQELYSRVPGRATNAQGQFAYMANFDPSDFLEDFAKHQRLEVFIDGRLAARLILNNTATAYDYLGRCALQVGTGG